MQVTHVINKYHSVIVITVDTLMQATHVINKYRSDSHHSEHTDASNTCYYMSNVNTQNLLVNSWSHDVQ